MAYVMPDGRLVFAKRGGPPSVPPGYDVDPQDPYVMIPFYEDCSKRTTQPSVMPCGKTNHRPWCKLHDCEATPATCAECPDVDFISVPSEILDAPSEILDAPTLPIETVGKVHDCSVDQTVPISAPG